MKALIATLRKEAVVRITFQEFKSHLFKALMLLTFTYVAKIWEANLKNPLEGFENGMKIHMMSHVRVRSLTTYQILLVKFE
jgi:hypothetical protein